MVSLKPFNTLGVDCTADALLVIESIDTVIDAVRDNQLADVILGAGSNVLITQERLARVWVNRLKGIEVLSEDDQSVLVKVGSGEVWHDWVNYAIDHQWYGLENLSLIPGTVGAAPIQNIGAYGVEVANTIEAVEVVDLQSGEKSVFSGAECQFGYRDSRFKHQWLGRYFISAVVFNLSRVYTPVLDYGGVAQEHHNRFGDSAATARSVADTIIAIRREKIPDPRDLANAGSFFKNPVVSLAQADALRASYPQMPYWPVENGVKLSAAWLIDAAGLKGWRDGDAGIAPHHALILVNYGVATGMELWQVALAVQRRVELEFNVGLNPEPLVI